MARHSRGRPGKPAAAHAPASRQPGRLALGAIAAIAAVAIGAGGWFAWRARRAAPFDGPIVLVSIDTLRADHLPAYGYQKVRTPAIDALAKDGVVFDRAYAQVPLTLPSHVSILSGQLPFETGVRDNMGFTVKPDQRMLPGMLENRGFATGGFVSAYVLRAATGIAKGFGVYDDRLPAASPEVAIGDVQRDGADTLAAAEKWVDGLTSPRFFLFIHFYEPHTPYTPPARYGQYLPYDGEIAYADELVGRLIDSLRRRGLYDRALVILLSDHGEGLGDHGEEEHGLFLYSETIRVPLVVKLPGERDKGLRLAQPVEHIDLVPTILDLLHAPIPSDLRGRSLVPLFDGGTIEDRGLYAESLYARYHLGWSELYALTDGRYRFIRAPRDELYDVQTDPHERRNLVPEREQTRVAMREALARIRGGSTVTAPGRVSAEDRQRLQALGYIGSEATLSETDADTLPDPKDKVPVLEEYRKGLEMVRRGRFGEAIAAFRGIVADNPGMADVWSELGGLLVRQGRIAESVEAYKRVVETTPHDPGALIGVADGLYRLGHLDEARAQAEAATKLLPASDSRSLGSAYQILAKVALARHDPARARAAAEAGQRAAPTLPLVDLVEGLIHYNAGQYAEALPYFQKAAEPDPRRTFDVPDVHYYLGDTLGRLDRYGEAEAQFKAELKVFPYNQRAWAGLAMLYRAAGHVPESDAAIAAMLQRSPTAEAYGLAEKLWTMFGEKEKAAQAAAEARKRR